MAKALVPNPLSVRLRKYPKSRISHFKKVGEITAATCHSGLEPESSISDLDPCFAGMTTSEMHVRIDWTSLASNHLSTETGKSRLSAKLCLVYRGYMAPHLIADFLTYR